MRSTSANRHHQAHAAARCHEPPHLALSGSGESYPRCEHHYALYAERLQQRDGICGRRATFLQSANEVASVS
jgi:hypothetical protein